MLKKPCLYLMLLAVLVSAPNRLCAAGTKGSSLVDQIVAKVVKRENEFIKRLRTYAPMVETYIQNLDRDAELGTVPKGDSYFLGKLDFSRDLNEKSLMPKPGFASRVLRAVQQVYSVHYIPEGFAHMILVDSTSFDQQHYLFEYVGRNFLGDVRCYVFDVKPNPKVRGGTFLGRIWVEDQDYNVVRFNGTYVPISRSHLRHSSPVHFDSWRQNMGPGLWLPSYVYSEESDLRHFIAKRKLRFKAQTRLWGYNPKQFNAESELTTITVETPSVRDKSEADQDLSPVLSMRAWERQAEDNILQRMERAGLLAPDGEVNKVLETVVTNLQITNKLDIQPEVRCRVLLTSPLESFTVGHAIVLSRGLIDVLPDEASLATMLAHELGHIVLGHRLDTKYAFNDRMLFEDEATFKQLFMRRDAREEADADTKAVELLKNSPYNDKLANAGLFLRAVSSRARQLPSLLRPHLGNRMAKGEMIVRMTELMQSAPELEMKRTDQIAALPLGSRIKLDPWNNTIQLIKAKPVPLLSAREKIPFEVTPILLHLTRQTPAASQSTFSSSRPD